MYFMYRIDGVSAIPTSLGLIGDNMLSLSADENCILSGRFYICDSSSISSEIIWLSYFLSFASD